MTPGEFGFDLPAMIGMSEAEVLTPALIVDLDAFERNLVKMRDQSQAFGVALRAHGKMHKCPEVARRQMEIGGAVGICCQKLAEAEAFLRGGVTDILITNQVVDPARIARLADLAVGPRIAVCVDDLGNVAALGAAMRERGGQLRVLVERDCGDGRGGAPDTAAAVALAKAVAAAEGLVYGGLQAYRGGVQHIRAAEERRMASEAAIAATRETVAALVEAGLPPATVTGAGTGSFAHEGASGVYTEIQCGSYAFMDADYGAVLDADGARLDAAGFENALFVLASVTSQSRPGHAVCDAGHKSAAVDSGLPVVAAPEGVRYLGASDEHGVLDDPHGALSLNQRLRLIPGHCDPTCNLHDWIVGVRDGRVETLWPVAARGRGL